MAEINFQYLEDGVVRTGVWEGDPDVAAVAAIRFLGAVWDPESESFMYEDTPTGEIYSVAESDLVAAGAALLAKAPDWYSIWCGNTGTPVGR